MPRITVFGGREQIKILALSLVLFSRRQQPPERWEALARKLLQLAYSAAARLNGLISLGRTYDVVPPQSLCSSRFVEVVSSVCQLDDGPRAAVESLVARS